MRLELAIEVGSGFGGAVAAARVSGRPRERSSAVWRSWRSGLPRRGALAASLRSSSTSSALARRAREPLSHASPSERNAGREASANGPRRVKVSFSAGRRALEVDAAAASARRSARPGAPSSGRARRGSAAGAGSRRRCHRGARPRCARCSRPSRPSARPRACCRSSSATTASESSMKSLIVVVWRSRMLERLLVSRRPGCALRRTLARSSGRPARPVPSSDEDQAEALAVGAAHDVQHQVGRDRRGGLVDRDRVVRQLLASSCRAGSRRSTRRSATAGGCRRSRRRGTTRSRAR